MKGLYTHTDLINFRQWFVSLIIVLPKPTYSFWPFGYFSIRSYVYRTNPSICLSNWPYRPGVTRPSCRRSVNRCFPVSDTCSPDADDRFIGSTLLIYGVLVTSSSNGGDSVSRLVLVIFYRSLLIYDFAHRPEWRWAVKVRYLDTDALRSGQQHRAETAIVGSAASVVVRVEQPGVGAIARVAAT